MTNSNIKFILFIVVTSTIGQMAAEVYVPSLPYISHEFNVTDNLTQITIAVFLFGMAIPALFFGYVSDYFGRRKVLIMATSISAFGSLMCMLAPNIYILIIGRLIQGLGFSGVGSMSRAILRDKMTGIELAKFASNLAMITVLVIDLSPFIGGFIQQSFGWRPIFGMILAYNLFAIYLCWRYDDGNSQLNSALDLHRILHSAVDVLQDKSFIKYNLMSGLCYAVIMIYLAVASFIFEAKIGLSPSEFGMTTFGLSFVYMFGSFLNGKLLHRFSMDMLIKNGIVLLFIASVWALLMATIVPLTYWGMIFFIVLIYFGCSAIFANSSAQAFGEVNKSVGTASALYSTVQILIAAIATLIISQFHTQSTFPLAMIMITVCILMVIVYNIKNKIIS